MVQEGAMLTYLQTPITDVGSIQEESQRSINEWEDEGGASNKINEDVDFQKNNNVNLGAGLICFDNLDE